VQYAKPLIFITGFNFFMQTHTKQQKITQKKEEDKNQKRLYKNGHNQPIRMLHNIRIAPCNEACVPISTK
jgi:hypothetical protein